MKINMGRKSLNEKPVHKEINTLLKIKEELLTFISANQLLKKNTIEYQNNNDIKLQYLCEAVQGMLFDIVHTQRKHSSFYTGKTPGNLLLHDRRKKELFSII
ncbi:MAG: hypothetical protein LBN19_02855 [Endomicrobium sp.]|jgi:hypothetical protein|nr:hypothetical protein [Endomicrobium sp.]